MNDVAYRLNTALPVRKSGTITVNNSSRSNLTVTASGSVYQRDSEYNMINETPGNTGLVNRFDDPTYYTA